MVIGISYPIAILIHFGGQRDAALRWIQNDPGFVANLCLLTPLAVAIALAKAEVSFVREFSSLRRLVSFGLLILLLVMALIHVVQDIGRGPATPLQLADFNEALQEEAAIRNSRRADKPFEDAADSYRGKFSPLANLAEVFGSRGSGPARVEVVLNGFCAIFLSFFFWYIANVLTFPRSFPKEQREWIVLVAFILALWFPLRAYSEWYRNFYDLQGMATYPAFWFLLVVAVCAFLILGFLFASNTASQLICAAAAAIVAIVSFGVKFKPEWFGGAAAIAEKISFASYISSMLIVAITLTSMVYRLSIAQEAQDEQDDTDAWEGD